MMPVASPTPHAHTAAPGLSSRAGLAPDLLIAPTASTTAGPHAAQTPMARVQQASRETFADVLAQQGRGPAAKPPKQMNEAELDERARKTAEDFVAIAFVQPILKGLRSSTLADLAPPLGPGPGEKQFRSIADAQTARSLVHASRWPLVDTIAARLRASEHARTARPSGAAAAAASAPIRPDANRADRPAPRTGSKPGRPASDAALPVPDANSPR